MNKKGQNGILIGIIVGLLIIIFLVIVGLLIYNFGLFKCLSGKIIADEKSINVDKLQQMLKY